MHHPSDPIDSSHYQWPELPLGEWTDTLDTLHMWLQIVGKIKLELTPFLHQWWNITLHPTAQGLTTGVIPCDERVFEIEFDFLAHQVSIRESRGNTRTITLEPRSVAAFYRELMSALDELNIDVAINPIPVEVPHQIPLDRDDQHSSYDPDSVTRWWRIVTATTRVMNEFRTGFTGKSSPVHFFWGSFDLNHTRHSGRPATPPSGVPRFFQLAENEENYSCGFWPGNTSASGQTYGEPAFFAYHYPVPAGYESAPVAPEKAHFDEQMGLFILRYADIRERESPDEMLLAFLQSTYRASADAASWDRSALEP